MKCYRCGQETNSTVCEHCGFNISSQQVKVISPFEEITLKCEQNRLYSEPKQNKQKKENQRFKFKKMDSIDIEWKIFEVFGYLFFENIIRAFITVEISTLLALLLMGPIGDALGLAMENCSSRIVCWMAFIVYFIVFLLLFCGFIVIPILGYFVEIKEIIRGHGKKVLVLIPSFIVLTLIEIKLFMF